MVEKINIMLDDGAYVPERAHEEDAGLDLKTPTEFNILAGESVVIDTGVHVQIPRGYVGMLKSKSGLNVNHGIVSEGVIDSGTAEKIWSFLKAIKPPNLSSCRLKLLLSMLLIASARPTAATTASGVPGGNHE